MYIEEEKLYGSLHVIINKLQGLTKPQCKWLHRRLSVSPHWVISLVGLVFLSLRAKTETKP